MVSEIKNESAHITIYQDPFSKRLRVDDYSGNIADVMTLINQSLLPWVEKLIIKSRAQDADVFLQKGYRQEAMIKRYFSGTDMHFLCRYFSDVRQKNPKDAEEEKMVRQLLGTAVEAIPESEANLLYASEHDAAELSELYQSSFPIYPTPLGDPGYVRKTILEGTLYVFVREEDKIVSAASAEINRKYYNAELTDCATSEQAMGKGYMRALLRELEKNLHAQGITCPYTIARSESLAMNKVFHHLGYTYGGRMTNNCMIYSGLEDMNVWYKAGANPG
jgi:putative beta-lysine N-acetyltransferase